MARRARQQPSEPPVVLVKWYDATKWLLERIDSFPKNQRFIFRQRMADRAMKGGKGLRLSKLVPPGAVSMGPRGRTVCHRCWSVSRVRVRRGVR
jgi:hypothetical protein